MNFGVKVLLVVNYHYIRDEIPKDGIYPVTSSFFRHQLELIHKNGYEFVSLNQINKVIKEKENTLPEKSCLITFDDGLKESYDIGLSILDEMGIPASFYIISDTLVNNKLINVHKLHYLRSKIDIKDIFSFLNSDIDKLDEISVLNQYPFDDMETAKIKYLLNFVEPKLINDTFSKYIDTPEEDIAKDLYMNNDQIKDLYTRGYLGTHGRAHKPLSTLSDDELHNDINNSKNVIENLCGGLIESMSYPYGETTAVDNRVIKKCKELDFVSGFTMFRGLNSVDELINNPLMIKRLDTNEVFGGKYENKYEL